MTLICPTHICPALQAEKTISLLDQTLAPMRGVKDGDIVAIRRQYLDSSHYDAPYYRTGYVVCTNDTSPSRPVFSILAHDQLDDRRQVETARLEMLMQADTTHDLAVHQARLRRRARNEGGRYSVFHFLNGAGVIDHDAWFCGEEWHQHQLDRFMCVALRRASDAREAISRHTELGWVMRTWRILLEVEIPWRQLPKFEFAHVSCLLGAGRDCDEEDDDDWEEE